MSDVLQGAEGSGDRDGDVHRHVLPLSADQDHEERPDADKRVSTAWRRVQADIFICDIITKDDPQLHLPRLGLPLNE